MKLLYRNDKPVSGACGDGRAFTNAEIVNLSNNIYRPLQAAVSDTGRVDGIQENE